MSLVLLRHGESTGNRDGLFTGMLDVPLTEQGHVESQHAGVLLRAADFTPDLVITSTMRRARQTVADLVSTGLLPVSPSRVDWRLSERNYGALTGRTKDAIRAEVGDAQYLEWRRSYDVAPPPMSAQQRAAILRLGAPGSAQLGFTESLSDVVTRVRRVAEDWIAPALDLERSVLVVAHGNSLRALCAVLDHLAPTAVAALNIPTGYPLLYQLDADGEPTVSGGIYLDPDNAAIAAELTRQGGGT